MISVCSERTLKWPPVPTPHPSSSGHLPRGGLPPIPQTASRPHPACGLAPPHLLAAETQIYLFPGPGTGARTGGWGPGSTRAALGPPATFRHGTCNWRDPGATPQGAPPSCPRPDPGPQTPMLESQSFCLAPHPKPLPDFLKHFLDFFFFSSLKKFIYRYIYIYIKYFLRGAGDRAG